MAPELVDEAPLGGSTAGGSTKVAATLGWCGRGVGFAVDESFLGLRKETGGGPLGVFFLYPLVALNPLVGAWLP